MAKLTSRARKKLKRSSFVFPGKRAYPIHDRVHGAQALARSSGKPVHAKVRAAVCRRYPTLPSCKRGG
jgi:hypothetical protein